MITRKIFPFIVSVFMVLSFSSSAQAEFFSVSAGIPVSHTFSNSGIESDGVSGFLVHLKLPIMIGLGMESYETGIKSTDSDTKLATNMYDIFWMTPIPVINFTIGAGFGTAEKTCGNGSDCGFDKSPLTQVWGQLGFSPIPVIDVHMSYHKVSGDMKAKDGGGSVDVGGTVMAVGASIIF
ncbi:MAG: hypothetical protein HQ517_10675 [SAR324 cluster bacterium]|nr:hypothetical protein [SAR324 cluster bacterium]